MSVCVCDSPPLGAPVSETGDPHQQDTSRIQQMNKPFYLQEKKKKNISVYNVINEMAITIVKEYFFRSHR